MRLVFGDRRSVPVRSTASVEWLLWAASDSVNTVLQFYVVFSPTPQKTAVFCGLRLLNRCHGIPPK